ncbi:MAG: CBS domain-containing protein [Actinomycetota bacterium]|nr:CBS domain-containing protein [Actinomycetota bacterium]
MTTDVLTIGREASLKEAATVMVNGGISGLPVVDDQRHVIGIITEADFVSAEADRSWGRQRRRLLANVFGESNSPIASTVGDVMTANIETIDRGSSVTEAARRMSDLGVKRLPVVTPDGTLEGIISRADVMAAFARPDDELKFEIESDVIERIMRLEPDSISVAVVDGSVTLSGTVETKSESRLIEELAVRVEGVVGVDSKLMYTHDDTRR